MKYSTGFITTEKGSRHGVESISHDLTLRAGLGHQLTAGHYSFLPLGTKVLRKIENIVREEMNYAGAIEILMPIMQPSSLWMESGRWAIYGADLFKLKDRAGRDFCLGPTHEEVIVDMCRAKINSYKDLPVTLYQINTKFRDEKRPRSGLIRAREFMMKDAYSFDSTEEGLNKSYGVMREAYIRILNRLKVNAIPTAASPGEIGGRFSEEFLAPASCGEDKFIIDPNGKALKLDDVKEPVNEDQVRTGIEIGHIFKLGTRYSERMRLLYADRDGTKKPVLMGCYGMGISRMIPTIIEQHNDEKGITWPVCVAPFEVVVLPIRYDNLRIKEEADNAYSDLKSKGIDVLLDDRQVQPSVKFKDADLIGIPFKLIIGEKTKTGTVECERRIDGQKDILTLDSFIEDFKREN